MRMFAMKKGKYAMKCNKYLYSVLAFCALVMWSCSPQDEPKPSEDKPLIILDTDIGSSTDDLFAMEMLYDYDRRGLCTLLGVIVNREGEHCAACADVMNTWHGSIPWMTLLNCKLLKGLLHILDKLLKRLY